MATATREQTLEIYAQAYETLQEALKSFPRDMWDFRREEGWSIHEIIVHIADAEANGYIRLRKFIAEPGDTIGIYDQPGWAKQLQYQHQDVNEAMALFQALRKANLKLLQSISAEKWDNTVQHPARGTVSVDWFLETYANHVPAHINQMQEVYAEWKLRG